MSWSCSEFVSLFQMVETLISLITVMLRHKLFVKPLQVASSVHIPQNIFVKLIMHYWESTFHLLRIVCACFN
jgi:hypothetical protein